MRIVGIIPARYKSSRYPGKPLVNLNGIPMVIRVANIASKALGKENVYIATEDKRIEEVVKSFGYSSVMTSDNCLTGTDRIYEVSETVLADIYVNIQGDEPLLNYEDINRIVEVKKENIDFVINGMCSLASNENPNNVNIPKVVVNKFNELLYMSRLAIPGIKDLRKGKQPDYKKQVCIYAFNKKELKAFGTQVEKAEYEKFEDIEVLRFFDLNFKVKMVEMSKSSLAVDVIEDVAKIEEVLRESEGLKAAPISKEFHDS